MSREKFQTALDRARHELGGLPMTVNPLLVSGLATILEALTELGEEVYPPAPVGRDVLYYGGYKDLPETEWGPWSTQVAIVKALRAYGGLSLRMAKELADVACACTPSHIRCATPEAAMALVVEIQELGGRAEVT